MAATLYTIDEAAQHLGVSSKTVRNLVKAGHLTIHRRSRDRRKYCDPAEVEELRVARESGEKVVVGREEFSVLRAQVRRLQATVEVLMRVLDSKDTPLNITKDYGEKVFVLCLEQLRRGSWEQAEVQTWLEIFLRLDENDLEQIAQATQDPKPWIPFLKLVAAMTAWVVGSKDYKSSLELQALHTELAEARRRLRTASLIYAETRGYADTTLDKYKTYQIPSRISDMLETVLRKNTR